MWAATIIFITIGAIAMTLALAAIIYGFVRKQIKIEFPNAKAYIETYKEKQAKKNKK